MAHEHSQTLFGAQLKALRLQLGITQAELSLRSGVVVTQLANMEAGTANPTLTAIVALAHALDVDPRDLLPQQANDA